MRTVFCMGLLAVLLALTAELCLADDAPGPLPWDARLALDEDWSSGSIGEDRWYCLRKKWGDGNHGVVPENVYLEQDTVGGRSQMVLVCRAHGDRYEGPIRGWQGQPTRVGGVLVSKPFLASGRYEIVMKIGAADPYPGGPEDPAKPRGAVPAIWTYGYRFVQVERQQMDRFVPHCPLYNPHMKAYGTGANEYWSELDFPEFGKSGEFATAMYNTFCQNRHDSQDFPVGAAADGQYHTYTTEWRTELEPLPGITDEQVVEHLGYWWVQDRSVPFDHYLGNPLKRLDRDRYAVYRGRSAVHWIDGRPIGHNTRFVPAMAAQLNLGIWLPAWAGPAPWETANVRFASVRVWQYDDPGDVRGVLTEDLADNFDPAGNPR